MLTHNSGPFLSFGIAKGMPVGSNPDAGPDISYQGQGMLDQRTPYGPGQGTNIGNAFFVAPDFLLYNAAPLAISTTNLLNAVAGQAPGAYTITAGTGITGSSSVLNVLTGQIVSTTAFAVGAAYAPVVVGRTNFFDPTKSEARALQLVSSSASDTGAKNILVSGWDVYGQPMNEQIAFNGVTPVLGKKAWKYINTITQNAGTTVGTVSVGTTDIFGFPMRVDNWEQATVYMNATFITASTGFVAAVTSTATATTGDVRGTYALQTASDGTKRVGLYAAPTLANTIATISGGATSGLYGVAQF